MSSNSKKKISDELENREKKCNTKVVYEYIRPSKDPYEFNDINEFIKKNPFNDDIDCSPVIPDVNIKTDKYNRYYKDIYTNARCNTANGFWVGSTINRNNNQDKGNCWKEEKDAECGGLLDNYKLVRKEDYINGNVSRDEIKKARNKCEINPKCYFKRISEYKRDCVSRNRIKINSNSSTRSSTRSKSNRPSKNSLSKIQLDFSNIEKSLNDYYSSVNKPATVDLIGKGNRCVEGYIYSNTSSRRESNSNFQTVLEEDINADIIDENIEAKIEYVNDLVKLEHIDETLSVEEFKERYYEKYSNYIQYLLINLDPNDKENEKTFLSYMDDDVDKFNEFIDEYNNYIYQIKNEDNIDSSSSSVISSSSYEVLPLPIKKSKVEKHKTSYVAPIDAPSGEHKYYYRHVAILYNKYFPDIFNSYEDRTTKNYNAIQGFFIRYLIFKSDPNERKNKKFLRNYMVDNLYFNKFKTIYKNNDPFEYSTFFPTYFNDSFDIYIEKIKKEYYVYGRFIIARTNPNINKNKKILLKFINNRDPQKLEEFIQKYNFFNKTQDSYQFAYIELFNRYFTNFYQYSIDTDFIYYVKNKIKLLDPTVKYEYDELKKFIAKPELMKEFKKNYALIETERNYDTLLEKLHKLYFPDYFGNIEKKVASTASSSSFISSVSTPLVSTISTISSVSSSIVDPPRLPTVPQSILNTICKNIYKNNLDKRGMLIWHSTGSGKTCTATAIMEGFWGTRMDIIYCSKIEALTVNPPKNFYDCATNIFPRFAGKSYKEMEKEFKNIRFLSFARLSNRIENNTIDLNNCILIIDEVHNIFRPLPNQKRQHELLEKLLLDDKKFPNLKVFILTATLGDNPNEIIKLLNIVKNNSTPKITNDDLDNMDVFKNKIRGLISYFDMSNDKTKFPIVIENEPKYINMSPAQFEEYIVKYNGVRPEHKNYDKLAAANSLNKYWMAARKYSNMLYKFEKSTTTLRDFSPKLEELITTIMTYPDEKQYAYSAFYENKGYGGQGILAVALELKKRGYEQLTPSEAKRILENPNESEKKPRYILAITTQLGLDKGKELNEMINLYNSPINSKGEYVNIILASQSFNEGLDLKGVRHIHIFEPLITWASDRQTIGRAARNCSHSDLRLKDWTVQIHRYISDFPKEITQDEGKIEELRNLIKIKEKEIKDFEANLQKESANLKLAKATLTKAKKAKINLDSLKKEITDYEAIINSIREKIKQCKSDIKKLEKELNKEDQENGGKTKTKGKKKGIKLDPKGVETIDRFIYKQALDKMQKILTLYQVMQESAVDCLILQNFHKNGNKELNCTEY